VALNLRIMKITWFILGILGSSVVIGGK